MLFFEAPPQNAASQQMLSDFEALKLKINYLQNLVDTKQKDIANLKNAFSYNVKYYNDLVEKQKNLLASLRTNSLGSYVNELAKTDRNSSNNNVYSSSLQGNDTLEQQHVDFSNTVRFLPHLTGQQQILQPKFVQTKNRFAELVIGVPTIKREKTSYLLETLKSVLDAMNELEKAETLVVIIIAEVKSTNQNFILYLIQLYFFVLLIMFLKRKKKHPQQWRS